MEKNNQSVENQIHIDAIRVSEKIGLFFHCRVLVDVYDFRCFSFVYVCNSTVNYRKLDCYLLLIMN